jgi:hypothetical protein
VSFALHIARCRTCPHAVNPQQIGGTCDGEKLVDRANAGDCPRGYFQAAAIEQQLQQQGYGPDDPRFPGKGGCGC